MKFPGPLKLDWQTNYEYLYDPIRFFLMSPLIYSSYEPTLLTFDWEELGTYLKLILMLRIGSFDFQVYPVKFLIKTVIRNIYYEIIKNKENFQFENLPKRFWIWRFQYFLSD